VPSPREATILMGARAEWLLLAVLGAATIVALQWRGEPEAPTAEELFLGEATSNAPQAVAAPVLATVSHSDGLPDSGHWRGNSELIDLDADGDLDLISSIRRWDRHIPGDGLCVWRFDAGAWTMSVDGLRRDMGYGGSAVADVNGDGRLDLAFSGHDVAPHVFLARESMGWDLGWSAYDTLGVCSDVALGDVTGDGHADLAVMGFFGEGDGLLVYRGDGSGAFERDAALLPEHAYGAEVLFEDLDRDGRLELLAATSLGPKVWGRTADGEWEERSEGLPVPEVGGSDLGLACRDLDGDGVQELLVAGMVYPGHDPLRVFRWDGTSWSRWGTGLPVDEAYFDVTFAQLSADGPPAIVAAGKFGITVVAMDAPGTFRRVGRLAETEGVLNVCAGDVTGDGRDETAYVGFGGVRVMELAVPLARGGTP
jgi:hypothetical protein